MNKNRELTAFFRLFVDEDAFMEHDFFIVMVILYVSAAFYILDCYQLVKRKSQAENLAILGIPSFASVIGASLAALFVHVPRPGTERIALFAQALKSEKLLAKLALVTFVWMFLWTVCYVLQRRRNKKERLRWVISCIPDALCTALILFAFLHDALGGKSSFFAASEWVLWVYLYAVYFLCCKIVLLAVVLFVRLYSVKITCFRWQEGKSASAFLHRYFYWYQSAILRNVLLFEGGMLAFLTAIVFLDPPKGEQFGEIVEIMGFLYAGAVFVVITATGPIRKGLRRFKEWGDAGRLKELFCREYFTQAPLAANGDYVVTRHFLVDVQRPGGIYFWQDLQSIGGWHLDGKGKSRSLYFSKAGELKVPEADAASSEAAFLYAKQWLAGQNAYSGGQWVAGREQM
ncbi:MAG: hypothetical protein NC254_00955 [bacterium]|nr:hypothetical protein [Clostridium sp.]MCM1536945.1 hypothetical protein [bacterium]